MTFQAVSRWLRGEAIPSQDKLQVLAEWLRIEPQALRFGERAALAVREQRGRWEDPKLYQERDVIETYLALPAKQRKVVREVVMALAVAARLDPDATPGER